MKNESNLSCTEHTLLDYYVMVSKKYKILYSLLINPWMMLTTLLRGKWHENEKKKNDTEDDKDNKKKRIKITKYILYPQDIHNNIAITGLSLSFPYAPFSIDSFYFLNLF